MGFGTEQPAAGGASRLGRWLWVVCAALVLLGVLAAAGRVPGATSESPSMASLTSSFHGDEVLGTRGNDVLRGTDSGDIIFAFGGDDRIYAGDGDDLVDGGNGADRIYAGDGDDRIRAFDGTRDVIWCGPGYDVAFVDAVDVTHDCEELIESKDVSSPQTPDPPFETASNAGGAAAPPVYGTVELEDEAWVCRGPVDVDLVKVSVGPELTGIDAVSLGPHCTGRIGRIEVDTWSGDGIKVQNSGVVAHDLVIESGVVRCRGRTAGYHQDGIQVMGGSRLTFRDVSVDCGGPGVNAALFIAHGGRDENVPTDVVFEGGHLGPGAAHTILLADSVRSGVRNTVICAGRFRSSRVRSTAIAPIAEGNSLRSAGDPKCRTK